MKNLKKKAFTLVELLVVIAIIAILAVAGVVGYVVFTKKAQQSNDTSLVSQLNEYMAAASSTDNINTVTDARNILIEDGIDLSTLKLTAKGYKAAFDIAGKKFYKVDGTKVDGGFDGNKSGLFVFVKSSDEAATYVNAGYAVYLQAGYNASEITVTGVGVDVGGNQVATVNYNGNSGNNNVVIRTNSAFTKLTINAPNDVVTHYGSANEINVTAVANSSYHENGSVATLNVKAGKIEVEKNAFVGKIAVDKDATVSTVAIVNEGTVFATEVITYNAEGQHQPVASPTDEQKAVINTVTTASSTDVITIADAESLINLASAHSNGITSKVLKVELSADIDLTGKEWIPFGASSANTFSGVFDGKGYKIIGLSNKYTDSSKLPQFIPSSSGISGSVFGLIAQACFDDNTSLVVKNLTMENVDIDGADLKGAAAVVGLFGDKATTPTTANVTATFDNVKVSGSIIGKDKVAGLVGAASHTNYIEGHSITFTNCTNSANVEAKSGSARAAGFIGQFGDGQADTKHSSISKLVFDNCVNNGNIASTGSNAQMWAGAFVAHANLSKISSTLVTIEIKSNCSNTGIISNATDPARVSILTILGN